MKVKFTAMCKEYKNLVKLVNFRQTHPLFLLVYFNTYMGDMFRLSVSHHQALLFLLKYRSLAYFNCAMGSHSLTEFTEICSSTYYAYYNYL